MLYDFRVQPEWICTGSIQREENIKTGFPDSVALERLKILPKATHDALHYRKRVKNEKGCLVGRGGKNWAPEGIEIASPLHEHGILPLNYGAD